MADWVLHISTIVLLVVTVPGTVEMALITLGALLRNAEHPSARPSVREISLAAIVPVHNEERVLAITIQSLLDCENPLTPQNIFVVACNTTDRSVAIAREMGCTVLERTDPTRRGKGYGLDFAFRMLENQGYDAYLIIDADTTVERNFLNEYRSAFKSGAEAGQCILRVANPGANTRTRLLNVAFLAFTLLRPLARHRLGFSAGIFGNGFGVRADTLRRIPYHCYSITEDLEYHLELVRSGVRVGFVGATSVSADMITTASGARSQRERWEGGRFRVMILQGPRLVRDIIIKGRLALIEPLLDLLLLPLVYHVLLLLVLALLSSGLLRIYAISSILLVIAHVCQAMYIGNATRNDWKTLLALPAYVGWKMLYLGSIIKAAKRSTPWRRTERLSKTVGHR